MSSGEIEWTRSREGRTLELTEMVRRRLVLLRDGHLMLDLRNLLSSRHFRELESSSEPVLDGEGVGRGGVSQGGVGGGRELCWREVWWREIWSVLCGPSQVAV